MNIELGLFKDGSVMMVFDTHPQHLVKRVEYYQGPDLMLLVYNNEEEDSDLMHYEVPRDMVSSVRKSPDVILYTVFEDHEPIGYKVPLITVEDI